MTTINIAGLDKTEVLLALWHQSNYQGLGVAEASSGLTREKAKQLVEETAANAGWGEVIYFDYVLGKVIKTEIGVDELDPRLYDRDNGHGAAAAALKPLLDARG